MMFPLPPMPFGCPCLAPAADSSRCHLRPAAAVHRMVWSAQSPMDSLRLPRELPIGAASVIVGTPVLQESGFPHTPPTAQALVRDSCLKCWELFRDGIRLYICADEHKGLVRTVGYQE